MNTTYFTYCLKILLLFLLLSKILACTPMIKPASAPVSSGQILKNTFITKDGTHLPLKVWQPDNQEINAVVIALHGFNDYSNFFRQTGDFLSQHNTISYAYDQRGFGGSPNRGLWAGVETYIRDLECLIHLVAIKHPDTPIFLLGESMGGAVVITTVAQLNQLPVKGIILAAPAVWARQTMPWYQNLLLWTLTHTVPWMALEGSGLEIQPSDNIEMLRALGLDPLVIKETRVDTIFGLVNLMDEAYASAKLISTNTLLLYGEKDEIIPKKPTQQFLNSLTMTDTNTKHIAFYKNGYHMLLRDLQASILWNDIASWIKSFATPLPSGADLRAQNVLANE